MRKADRHGLNYDEAIHYFARSRIVDGKNFAELISDNFSSFIALQSKLVELKSKRPPNWRDRDQYIDNLRAYEASAVEHVRVILMMIANLTSLVSSSDFLKSEEIFKAGYSGTLENLAELIWPWYAITGCAPAEFAYKYPKLQNLAAIQPAIFETHNLDAPKVLQLAEKLYQLAFENIEAVPFVANISIERIEARLEARGDEKLKFLLEQQLRERLPSLIIFK